jgi:hypothetical protein
VLPHNEGRRPFNIGYSQGACPFRRRLIVPDCRERGRDRNQEKSANHRYPPFAMRFATTHWRRHCLRLLERRDASTPARIRGNPWRSSAAFSVLGFQPHRVPNRNAPGISCEALFLDLDADRIGDSQFLARGILAFLFGQDASEGWLSSREVWSLRLGRSYIPPMARKQREPTNSSNSAADPRVPPGGMVRRLRPPTPAIDVAKAVRLYTYGRLSFAALAARFEYSEPGIRRLLVAHGVIPRRTAGPRDRTTITLRELWRLIRRRCEVPSDRSYRHYGAVGVKGGHAWTDFEVFRRWALERGFKPRMGVLRVREAGDFAPGNCRVVPRAEVVATRFKTHPPAPTTASRALGETKGIAAWV